MPKLFNVRTFKKRQLRSYLCYLQFIKSDLANNTGTLF